MEKSNVQPLNHKGQTPQVMLQEIVAQSGEFKSLMTVAILKDGSMMCYICATAETCALAGSILQHHAIHTTINS